MNNSYKRSSALLRSLASLQAALTIFALVAMSSPLMVYAQETPETAQSEETELVEETEEQEETVEETKTEEVSDDQSKKEMEEGTSEEIILQALDLQV